MTIITQWEDSAGYWRTKCELINGSIVIFKSITFPTTQELETFEADYIAGLPTETIPPFRMNIDLQQEEIVEEFLTLVKQNPSVNLTQYNNWLALQDWQKSSFIRFFIFRLSVFLAEQNNLTLDDYTETEVLLKLRNWIVASSEQKLRHVVYRLQE